MTTAAKAEFFDLQILTICYQTMVYIASVHTLCILDFDNASLNYPKY